MLKHGAIYIKAWHDWKDGKSAVRAGSRGLNQSWTPKCVHQTSIFQLFLVQVCLDEQVRTDLPI